MATRSSIQIEGVDYAEVYKHWDGYPSNMLHWLEEFNQAFAKNRGDDPEYKFAQLLRWSTEKSSVRSEPYTGWGVIPFGSDMGQDYIYTLKKDGSVTVEPESEE